MRSGPDRRSRRPRSQHDTPKPWAEGLEPRRLLCMQGVDQSGGSVHEIHLYDAAGHHFALDGIPDAGTIDIPDDASATGMGPLPAASVTVQPNGPQPARGTLQTQNFAAADSLATSVP